MLALSPKLLPNFWHPVAANGLAAAPVSPSAVVKIRRHDCCT
jgi:hypothetical protein